jgi:hypothetical protein
VQRLAGDLFANPLIESWSIEPLRDPVGAGR